ncbi:MAG: hypothetical protein ACHQZR_04085 [Candidatus Limnocylindrales bacterium]
MNRSRSLVAACALILVLGACSSTTTPTPVTGQTTTPSSASTPTAAPTPAATPTPTASEALSSGSPGIPTAIDPCKLLTDAQASAVNGVTYGPGVSHAMNQGAVECVWQNASAHASVTVQVLVASSVSDAESAWAESQAAIHGFNPTNVPNPTDGTPFADQAVIARAPSGTANTGGIYVREGVTYFDVVYLGGTAPSDGQLELAATLVLGALP